VDSILARQGAGRKVLSEQAFRPGRLQRERLAL